MIPGRASSPLLDGTDLALLAPDIHRALLGLGSRARLEASVRELVEIRTAQLAGCADTLTRHAREAVWLGETQRRLAALGGWRRSRLFTERERAALALAEALALPAQRDSVAAARRDAAALFDEAELAQLVLACVSATAWSRLELAFDGLGAD